MPETAPVVPLLGVDLVPVERIDRLMRHNREMVEGFLAPGERGRPHTAESVAGRFAAKEAVGKLLGTGLANGVEPHEIEIRKDRLGQPQVELSGGARERAADLGLTRIGVSITHSSGLAISVAAAIPEPSRSIHPHTPRLETIETTP